VLEHERALQRSADAGLIVDYEDLRHECSCRQHSTVG
jgi:hypothetical protein